MTRLYWNILVIAAALIALALYGAEQRKRGAAEVRDEARADSLVVARALSDSLRRQYRADTVRLTRWLTRYDTARVTLNLRDTVEVLRFVAVADSTVAACTTALGTCEARVGAAWLERDLWASRYDDAVKRTRLPWTSLGVAYDVRAGGVGVYADRDVLWRLRLGVTATGDGVGVRAGLRW